METDRGLALETDLIRDSSNLISMTLEQHLWQTGLNKPIESALNEFLNDWEVDPPATRAFIPHNLLLQEKNTAFQIRIIDGLGRQSKYVRFLQKLPFYDRSKVRRKDLMKRIQRIIEQRDQGLQAPNRVSNLNR